MKCAVYLMANFLMEIQISSVDLINDSFSQVTSTYLQISSCKII